LKSSPKVKLWRLLGKFTNSKLMLYLAGVNPTALCHPSIINFKSYMVVPRI
jgi:hypothetical protein